MLILEWLTHSWHWSISGLMIAMVLFLMMYFGEKFGVSTSFQTLCSIGGAKKWSSYFNVDWRKHDWLLVFVIGSILGGLIASTLLAPAEAMAIAPELLQDLSQLGIGAPTVGNILPQELFGLSNSSAVLLLMLGGLLVGFGARYAGGCTSGHAITGLSNFQLPSLLAVVGFFIGGLLMTHFLFPFLFNLL
ncbi:MAG: YeeE/YedE family protein [Saprospiraceae bacterium]|nr:YeeE/YedE family protein [Saprospiraceae bacterium]